MASLKFIEHGKVLNEIDKALELKQQNESERTYLGASQIGEPCHRKLFYSFRKVCKRQISAKGIRSIEDGFMQEKVMAERLRMVPSIELYTHTEDGQQIGFEMMGFLRGHIDGMILNPLDGSPTKFEIWEHKSVNLEKFAKLTKLIHENEKTALESWDIIYYNQAILYMKAFDKDRHFLTVTSPGGRDYQCCRTEYSEKKANLIIEKAKSIIFEDDILPSRISEKREFFSCNWCEYQGVCFDGNIPKINCGTCRYRNPNIQTKQFECLLAEKIIPDNILHVGCKQHVFSHALMPGVTFIDEDMSGCYYQIGEITFANVGMSGFPDCNKKIDCIFTSEQLKALGNVNEIPSHSTIQGEIESEAAKLVKKTFKAWE